MDVLANKLDESLKQLSNPQSTDLEIIDNEFKPSFKRIINSIHFGITCDECGVYGIKGRRYKCLVCPNYDLCESCESNLNHDHPMMKVNNPIEQIKLNELSLFYSELTNANCGQSIQKHREWIEDYLPNDKQMREEMLTRFGCLKLPLFVKKVKMELAK